jgi:hypothetical protein
MIEGEALGSIQTCGLHQPEYLMYSTRYFLPSLGIQPLSTSSEVVTPPLAMLVAMLANLLWSVHQELFEAREPVPAIGIVAKTVDSASRIILELQPGKAIVMNFR